MINIEIFREIIIKDLGSLWENVQSEVNQYFNIIDFAIIEYRKNYHKLVKPKEDFLNDPLNIPEIYKLLYSVKEYNFNYFNRNQVTQNYNHFEHAYIIKENLLSQLEPIIKRVENFRIEKFPKILDKQGMFEIKEKFITYNFENYGLFHYSNYVDIINGIAYHEKYYVILPNLLRCLLENLLHDIFSYSLEIAYKELFFDKTRSKIRDFSQLIELLNMLRVNEFKAYIKDIINENSITILKEIKKIGNYSVHDVIRKIPRSYVNEIQDKTDLILQSLLISFQKLKQIKISIDPDRQALIKEKLGIKKKEKRKEIPKQPKKVVKIRKNENKEKKIIQELFDYFIVLFNHFEEVEKPKNNNEYKNNRNYLYFKYKLKKSGKNEYYDADDLKHKIVDATDKLKRYLVKLGYYNYSDVKELIKGYYLKLPVSGIRIEQNKISIHKSKEQLLEDPTNMKSCLKYFIYELESLANEKDVQLNNVFSIKEYKNTFSIKLDDSSIAYMKNIYRLLKHKLSLNDFLERALYNFIISFQSNVLEAEELSFLNALLEYNWMRENNSKTEKNILSITLDPQISEKLHKISQYSGVNSQVIIEFGLKDELNAYNFSNESRDYDFLSLFIDK